VIETYQHSKRRQFKASRIGSLLQKGSWGLCDQGVISASNFITTVVLARSLGPTNFGAFTLVYAAIFFANALQSALVTRPHNIVGATYHGAEYRRYTTATAVSQIGLTGILALIAFLCAVVAHSTTWKIAPLLFPLVLALVAWQLQEFCRRVLYTEGRLKVAFANDALSYGAQAIGIIVLGGLGQLTGARALSIIALTSAIAAAWGGWEIKKSVVCQEMWDSMQEKWLAENWRFGKWIFGAIVIASVFGQLYPVLIDGFISIAEAGIFRAIVAIFGPVRILLMAMETAVTPAAARIYNQQGQTALHVFIVRIVLLTAPVIVTYCLLMSIFAEPILVTLFGDAYRPYGWLLALLAVTNALTYLLSPVQIAIEGRQVSAPIFQASLWSGVVGLTLGVAAIYFFGLLGAVLGMILGLLVANAILWQRYHRMVATTAAEGIQ